MTAVAFPNRPRVDAHEKVLGATHYAVDVPLPGMLYAMTVPATIAKSRITAMPVEPAMSVSGVVRVLTATDFPPPPVVPGTPPPPEMITIEIAYRGQPVALVVAETLEAAIEGAEAIRPVYAEESFLARIDSPGAMPEPAKKDLTTAVDAGDANSAMARSVTRLTAEYVSPAQHHNPIEMLSTTAVWEDEHLTIHEGTQGSNLLKGAVVANLRLQPEQVTVKSPQVGGAFGQKGVWQCQTTIVARAVMLIGRPVKLVMPRGQVFHNATFRPKSRHRIEFGADASGKMIVLRYDADQQQSRKGEFAPRYYEIAPQTYGIADYLGTAENVRIDTQNPRNAPVPTLPAPPRGTCTRWHPGHPASRNP